MTQLDPCLLQRELLGGTVASLLVASEVLGGSVASLLVAGEVLGATIRYLLAAKGGALRHSWTFACCKGRCLVT